MKSCSDQQLLAAQSLCLYCADIKKKNTLKTHIQSLLGGLGVGMMLLERKRRASSSFEMFSKQSGCRMWGKRETQGCGRLPQCRASGHSVGSSPGLWLLSRDDRVGETQPGSVGALPSPGAPSAGTFAAGKRGLCWLGFGQLKWWAGDEAWG